MLALLLKHSCAFTRTGAAPLQEHPELVPKHRAPWGGRGRTLMPPGQLLGAKFFILLPRWSTGVF